MSGSLVLLLIAFSVFWPVFPFVSAALASEITTRETGFTIPIQRRGRTPELVKRGNATGDIGLGDNSDLLYTVPVEIGSDVTIVNLDTGSSDFWVITDTCTADACDGAKSARFDSSSLNASGSTVTMKYGDSTSGTSASGPIAFDTATIAGISIENQAFAAITQTTNPTVKYAAGIFGLGFHTGSKVQEALVTDRFGALDTTDDFLRATTAYGPTLARIAWTGALQAPMFAIELQRNTIDIGGGDGVLTVGRLPEGVNDSMLTWVPVRMYRPEDGGLSPPTFAPDEVYPYRWEIEIDGVYLNGVKLDASTENATDGVDTSKVSALIDTGNSILRGPSDVVNNILTRVSPGYDATDTTSKPTLPCAQPHNLSFLIGGKQFPVDPRDFIGAASSGNATECVASKVVATDPPSRGSLFRWSLGDPFFKSNLVVFHYGNLTHPSVDPPRIGLMSLVPVDAEDKLQKAVEAAQSNGGNFRSSIELAPTAEALTGTDTTVSFSGSAALLPTVAPSHNGGILASISALEPIPATTLNFEAPSTTLPPQSTSTLTRMVTTRSALGAGQATGTALSSAAASANADASSQNMIVDRSLVILGLGLMLPVILW
ncbi:acid protease [Cylindrobasidium torrendii FP15055 ss-10]|uniref:Acid protease n=1 Tax=Cylindrobasidium torrendii FP15055 ss-10 TaxID=1314674 RepID=A0A0D7BTV9_9AGAR|nr:acid protease [Cylindrobasidium torrendii FP15055 ss-10]